jgi:hypothetical protein
LQLQQLLLQDVRWLLVQLPVVEWTDLLLLLHHLDAQLPVPLVHWKMVLHLPLQWKIHHSQQQQVQHLPAVVLGCLARPAADPAAPSLALSHCTPDCPLTAAYQLKLQLRQCHETFWHLHLWCALLS